ncbi:DEAD/DEAH box helicase [Streptomyces odontomachi]|uniref:DEAD/DEAH box helicase n=1 Tax=Streptomyces odontomachi TaxID=2944940 RepID=UPI002108E5BD|nr:DEAD/DEAH box helicase [Streptomyces sp. ODS25]
MSVSSPDHVVVPEDGAEPVAASVTEAPVSEAAVSEAPATEAPVTEAPAAPREITFADLGLPDGVVRKLGQNGVTTPFPIQAATIPDALAGRDILGRGRTGSGKTLSFGLPLLALLAGGHTAKKHPRGVVLTPTRELAMQVADALQPYGDVLGLKIKVVCGGTSMGNQIYALERGVDILVATPGRLRDIIGRGACSLDSVQIAVLDEADQMADLGFLPEVTELLDQVPEGGQRMLFSATLDNDIDTLIKRYLHDPVTHEVDPSAGAVTTMSHHILIVKPRDKAPVTAAIAARKGRTIIFVRTQMGADRISEQLRDAGVRADALHGGMTQGARTRTLADFKDGRVNVLVATDVAARGIHVDGIDLVLNVDPAGDHKDYLHRAGRTARAGQSGTVVSLALPHQRRQTFRLMEDAGVSAGRHVVGGGGVFDAEVAEITGARSMTEVQAESTGRAAHQAEREVKSLTRELERAQRRATELREEADRLLARAARERGEDPAVVVEAASVSVSASTSAGAGTSAVTAASAAADADAGADAAVVAEVSGASGERSAVADSATGSDAAGVNSTTDSVSGTGAGAPSVTVPRQSGPRDTDRYDRYDRSSARDDRSSYERRDRDGDRNRGDRDRFRDRRFDRDRDRDRGGYDRDRGFGRGGDRDGDRRFGRDRDQDGNRGFSRDRGDRGGRPYDRRDGDRDRGARSFERRDRDGFRRDGDRGGRSFDRRDGDRGDRGGRSFERRDDRGGAARFNDRDRGFSRDRDRNDRPAASRDRGARDGFRRDDRDGRRDGGRPWDGERPHHKDRPFRHDRPYQRDHRDRRDERHDRPSGGPSGGHRSGGAPDRPYGRRDDRRGGSGSPAAGGAAGGFRRREDKPRWKRKG